MEACAAASGDCGDWSQSEFATDHCRRWPGIGPLWRAEVSRLGGGVAVGGAGRQIGNGEAKTGAEVGSGGGDGQAVDGGPQVELGSGGMAVEAAVTVAAEMDGEDSAARPGVAVDRAGATQARAAACGGNEVQQVQHLPDWDLRTNLLEVDPRHDAPGRADHADAIGSRPNREEAKVFTPLTCLAAWTSMLGPRPA